MSNDIESHLIENRVFIRRSGKIMRRLPKQIAGGGENAPRGLRRSCQTA